ncbi:CoA ester lyase [Brevundimonas sp. 2R-24]|uniref:CoA ester lyase n=1 Tax=Peiella sedimenti TaxID=3061083 RepID=A0ABT8SQH0_9CAUL|nr:CoA ester lyase [Caulobacteraceae bacterium XZ-24]
MRRTAERPLRSVLFLPAERERAVAKARTLPCDAVALDLEDAVGPEAKDAAREAALAALAAGFGERLVALRLNALSSPWGGRDLEAAARAAPDAVILPKVEGAADVARAAETLPETTAVWAMIETPAGLMNLAAIASAAPGRLKALILGQNDLLAELGAQALPGRPVIAAFAPWILAAARANGLFALDGVYNAFADAEGFAAECAQGRAWGFDGKTLIHPSQVAPCNAAFSPSEAELAWARSVVELFGRPENSQAGAVRLGDQMVERLHLRRAEALLASLD